MTIKAASQHAATSPAAIERRTSAAIAFAPSALTVIDLLTRPELVMQAWDYFKNVQTKDKKYIPLIRPEDKPAIWLNVDILYIV